VGKIFSNRVAIAVASVAFGAVSASAIAMAVTNESPETFYACKTSAGKIRAGTIRTGSAPTCRADRGESLASWSGGSPSVTVIQVPQLEHATLGGLPSCIAQSVGGCATVVPIGSAITVTVAPEVGWAVDTWATGPCVGSSSMTCSFAAANDTTLTPIMEFVGANIPVEILLDTLPQNDEFFEGGNLEVVVNNDAGSPPCTLVGSPHEEFRCALGDLPVSSSVTVTATANSWGVFDRWNDAPGCNTAPSCTFIVGQGTPHGVATSNVISIKGECRDSTPDDDSNSVCGAIAISDSTEAIERSIYDAFCYYSECYLRHHSATGTQLTITASGVAGWQFDHWEDSSSLCSGTLPTCSIPSPSGVAGAIAVFSPTP
jgi:Divergent InlB B-repeat domain